MRILLLGCLYWSASPSEAFKWWVAGFGVSAQGPHSPRHHIYNVSGHLVAMPWRARSDPLNIDTCSMRLVRPHSMEYTCKVCESGSLIKFARLGALGLVCKGFQTVGSSTRKRMRFFGVMFYRCSPWVLHPWAAVYAHRHIFWGASPWVYIIVTLSLSLPLSPYIYICAYIYI